MSVPAGRRWAHPIDLLAALEALITHLERDSHRQARTVAHAQHVSQCRTFAQAAPAPPPSDGKLLLYSGRSLAPRGLFDSLWARGGVAASHSIQDQERGGGTMSTFRLPGTGACQLRPIGSAMVREKLVPFMEVTSCHTLVPSHSPVGWAPKH